MCTGLAPVNSCFADSRVSFFTNTSFVPLQGFEPRLIGSEPIVLPLDECGISLVALADGFKCPPT